jgi:hypothetical protein
VLVQVALLMVVFLILLAFAIDVGHFYQVRRQMQNAADAGALAGARELCFGWPALAEYTAWDYANRNGGVNITVDITDYVVTVVSRIDTDTYFAGVIGIDTVDIGAEAQAACGSARSACGLWPVALSIERWTEVKSWPCGEHGMAFYVWSGDNPNQQPDCFHPDDNPTGIHDCDVRPKDGINEMVTMLQRAWLDFSDLEDLDYADSCNQPGCGAMELACWIRNDAGAPVDLGEHGVCIAGDTGVKAGVKDDVQSRQGDTVAIPIFDQIGCGGVTCPGTSIRAIQFGCIEVGGWIQNLTLPRKDGENPPWKGPVIEAFVSCETCETYCGSTIGGPPIPGGVKAVSLIR